VIGETMLTKLGTLVSEGIRRPVGALGRFETGDAQALFSGYIVDAFLVLAPLFAIVAVAALLGPAAIGGMSFSAGAARPKLSRLSPKQGLKRVFSAQGA